MGEDVCMVCSFTLSPTSEIPVLARGRLVFPPNMSRVLEKLGGKTGHDCRGIMMAGSIVQHEGGG